MPPRVLEVRETDEALAERCRHGDQAAFAALVGRYQRPLYNAAYRVLGREDDARDVTQVVFLKVAERLESYDARYRFFSWIYRIAVNEALNALRGRHDAEALDEQTEAEGLDPQARASAAELGDRVQRALMRMKFSDRAVLVLRHFSEYSYDEIGQILDVDAKTVKSRLFEARSRLRALLEATHTA